MRKEMDLEQNIADHWARLDICVFLKAFVLSKRVWAPNLGFQVFYSLTSLVSNSLPKFTSSLVYPLPWKHTLCILTSEYP